jgi:aspartyl-tRNA(Asn)/glutamyl-tRNA(Gln) amidotransferase subunit B
MEIVSEPDIRSPEEARQYLTTLRYILRYIEVTTGSMEEGNFRCDANVSIRPMGISELATRTEVKNMNSFRSVFSALEYEVERQRRVVEDGGRVVQETRGWLEDRGVTVSQRSKEHAHDYRYFPEPDLPELLPDPAWVEEIRASLPELPAQRRDRFVSQYALPLYDAGLLTANRPSAEFFEEAVDGKNGKAKAIRRRAKRVSNWMLGEVSRLLDDGLASIDESPLKPEHLGQLSNLVESGDLSSSLAKTVLQKTFQTGKAPKRIVKDEGYVQISDSSVVEQAVQQAIDQNPKAVQDYLGGRETASKFLVGQVMRITRGKANPAIVNNLVLQTLNNLQNTDGSS